VPSAISPPVAVGSVPDVQVGSNSGPTSCRSLHAPDAVEAPHRGAETPIEGPLWQPDNHEATARTPPASRGASSRARRSRTLRVRRGSSRGRLKHMTEHHTWLALPGRFGFGRAPSLGRPVSFHDLRHSGITWRAVRGDEALKVQRAARHDDRRATAAQPKTAQKLVRGDGIEPPTRGFSIPCSTD
jgi:hypothetical protein